MGRFFCLAAFLAAKFPANIEVSRIHFQGQFQGPAAFTGAAQRFQAAAYPYLYQRGIFAFRDDGGGSFVILKSRVDGPAAFLDAAQVRAYAPIGRTDASRGIVPSGPKTRVHEAGIVGISFL